MSTIRASDGTGGAAAGGGQPRQVVVIEDEFLIAKDISRVLERLGFEVVGPFPSVVEARDAATAGSPRGAVLDVNLRGELVFGFARALLQTGVPIIFTTGYDPADFPEHFRDCAVLQKPFSSRALRALITREFGGP
jgi:DNA-binding response OmpR family regulator